MLRPSSTHHTARMAAIVRALFLLILFSHLIHAAPVEPVTANINTSAVNSDDPFRQFPPENQPNPSNENDDQSNTYRGPNGESEYNWFPPGISLSTCEGLFRFSVNITDVSLNNTPPLFPYPSNSDQEFDVLHRQGHAISCKATPDEEKDGEMKVSCRCGRVRLSVFDTIYLWAICFVLIFSILDKIVGSRNTDKSTKGEDLRNCQDTVHQPRVYQGVSQTGSETETGGKDTVEAVADDDVGEDFDDSNYPMG